MQVIAIILRNNTIIEYLTNYDCITVSRLELIKTSVDTCGTLIRNALKYFKIQYGCGVALYCLL